MSSCGVPAHLVPKKDVLWLMFIDSPAVNKISIDYYFLIPCLDDLIDRLHGVVIFSKIDLRSGYHQFVYDMVMNGKQPSSEWMVMPFGLFNASSTFMRLMNHVFESFVGRFVVIYFDDIFVCNKS